MKKIIFTYVHYSGWGDSLISIFDILNCADFIKKKYPDIQINFVVNDAKLAGLDVIFREIFNIDFLNSFFDKWEINMMDFSTFSHNNKCNFDGEMYTRVYSGRNYSNDGKIPGIFDVYYNVDMMEYSDKIDVDFARFTFENDGTSIIKDFPIFNLNILNICEDFVNHNLGNDFESIHCRFFLGKTDDFINKVDTQSNFLKENLNPVKKYFVSSDRGIVKNKLKHISENIVCYTDADSTIFDGYGTGGKRDEIAISAIIELIIHSFSKKIYYYQDYGHNSYFTWYARNVKMVPSTPLFK